ncbi:MAG: Uma2 family endonuclease [Polyangiaceae bacterium]
MSQPSESHLRPPGVDQLVVDDGEPMESARHRQQMMVLIESLEYAWRGRTDFYVGGNMFLYFSETQTRKNDFRGPDVFVVMNTSRRERKAWVVWEEDGQAPDVVIELTSESTEHVDRGDKMRIYARALRVAEYFLFDPFSAKLEGYELDSLSAAYVQKQPDSEGRLACKRLGLSLGVVPGTLWSVEAPWLRWLRAGEVLPMPSEAALSALAHADAETERANAETERANAEAERANGLAAELEALRRR